MDAGCAFDRRKSALMRLILMIQPDGVADDFGRKTVAVISRFALAHPFSVPDIGLD